MDEFERRFAVALKTAAADLPVETCGAVERQVDLAPVAPRRHRARVLLAAAVVVLLVAAVGGTWWGVAGTGDRATPAGDGTCTADDVTVSQLPTDGVADRSTFVVLGVRATTPCTVTQAPTFLVGSKAVAWRSSSGGSSAWSPVTLARDDVLAFGVSLLPVTGIFCPDVYDHPVRYRFGLDASASLTSFERTTADQCSTYALTTVPALSSLTSDATTPCTADDLGPTQIHVGDDGFDPDTRTVAAIGYQAGVACTLTEAPTMSSGGTQYRWDPTPQDTTDPSTWQPVDLQQGAVITFGVVQEHLAGADCVVGDHAQEVVLTLLGRDSPVGTTVSSCGPIVLTTEKVTPPSSGPTTHAPDAPCSSADLFVAPSDIGQGSAGTGVEVVAFNACTLEHPPTVSVDLADVAYSGSATDPGATTPWMPTALQAGDHVRFALTFGNTSGVSCAPTGDRDVTVRAQVDGGARTVFRWAAASCVLGHLRLTPHAIVNAPGPAACTEGDLDVSPVVTAQTVTYTFAAHAGVRCRFIDPPTVMAGDEMVAWRPSTDLQTTGDWPEPVLEPGHDIGLTVQRVCPTADCPQDSGPTNLAVAVETSWVGKGVVWNYRGNAGILVSRLQ